MSAQSDADEEVSDKPFTGQALRRATAGPRQVSGRRNLLESKRVLLENGPVANLFVTKRELTGEREGQGSSFLFR